MSKKLFAVVVSVVVALVFALYILGGRSEETGTFFIAVKNSTELDANTQSATLTIKNIEVWNSDRGWVLLAAKEQTIDLVNLQAQGNQVVLARVDLPESSFDRIRFETTKVMLTPKDGMEYTAPMVSRFLSLDVPTQVRNNETSGVLVDLRIRDSLYSTLSGNKAFIPYVQAHVFTNIDLSDTDGEIKLSSHEPMLRAWYGMDATGNMRAGYRLAPESAIEVRNTSILISQPATPQKREQNFLRPPANPSTDPVLVE